jgi:hypothetical protein
LSLVLYANEDDPAVWVRVSPHANPVSQRFRMDAAWLALNSTVFLEGLNYLGAGVC